MADSWTNVTNAREMPDGTIVRYDGEDWIAYPEREIGGQLVRWQSEDAPADVARATSFGEFMAGLDHDDCWLSEDGT
jgi:hypothetical protein